MSDSDEDFMTNNVLKYQHERPGIRTQGPNRYNNNSHITSFGIRNNNMMTSTFDMHNYERQRYRGPFDQRSICYRRETSPMSLRSFPDSGIQNFRSSYYPHGMSSQRSVFNGRCGSPLSVRSIDSNVSAADIALIFKTANYNKYEFKIIKEAYSKLLRNRVRKKRERRRNLKSFLKGTIKDTGYDSREQSSDSSISSDDCRSTRTAIYKENLPIPMSRPRPSKMDMTQLRNIIQESDMYQDCTGNVKQNSLRNMLLVKNTQVNTSSVTNITIANSQNGSLVSLKDRFAKGNSFVLPSQRFTKPGNKINDEISKGQSNTMQTRQAMCNFKENVGDKSFKSNSGNEEIFSEVAVRENVQEPTLLHRKRNFNLEESNYSDVKRKKFTSPIKHSESLISSTLNNTQNNNCIFKKPQMPVRKSTKDKSTIFNDKLIAKSGPSVVDDFEPDFNLRREDTNNETEVSQNTTDVSMKPSFIKRKLFSQKLDVLDKKNQSTDNVVINSPQIKLYAGEKHKVRKLASSQSCLNRDVLGNDNVLDLIHKIVPRDKMNITNTHNKKEIRKSLDEDKWDVTSVISMCNNEDVSDTFTDEEIFEASQNKTKVNNNKNKVINMNSETNKSVETKVVTKQKINEKPKNKNTTKKTKLVECKVILNNFLPKICNNNQDKTIQSQYKKTVSSCVKSFWDTDFESDMEEQTPFTWNSKFASGKDQENNSVVNNVINLPKKNGLKSAVLTVRTTRSKGLNSSSRSDNTKVSQKINENDNQKTKEQIRTETLNKKSKSNCKTNLNTSVPEVKNKGGRPKPKDLKNTNSVQKCPNTSKETSKKQNKNDAVKKVEIIKIRTPKKVNEKKKHSSLKSNESSFNCSNISSISLRVRKKTIDYKC